MPQTLKQRGTELLAQFKAAAKSENVGNDPIDWLTATDTDTAKHALGDWLGDVVTEVGGGSPNGLEIPALYGVAASAPEIIAQVHTALALL